MAVLQNPLKLRVSWHGRTELTEVPGGYKKCCPVPRVLWHGSHRAHSSSGYGYECPTELTEVPGTGMKVLRNWHGRTELPEVPGGYKNAVPVPRALWNGGTDFTEVPGTGTNVAQNSHKFFVLVNS